MFAICALRLSAAAYAWGDFGSNGCPSPTLDYVKITTDEACKTAASAAALDVKPYGGELLFEDFPSGCFVNTATNKVYLNSHVTGAGNAIALPLCAGAPSQAAALRRLRGACLQASKRTRRARAHSCRRMPAVYSAKPTETSQPPHHHRSST